MFGIVYLLNCAAAYSGAGACNMEQQINELEKFISNATKEQLINYASIVSSYYVENEFISWLKEVINEKCI